jgi:rRNA processing protein Krr1/Pno1
MTLLTKILFILLVGIASAFHQSIRLCRFQLFLPVISLGSYCHGVQRITAVRGRGIIVVRQGGAVVIRDVVMRTSPEL